MHRVRCPRRWRGAEGGEEATGLQSAPTGPWLSPAARAGRSGEKLCTKGQNTAQQQGVRGKVREAALGVPRGEQEEGGGAPGARAPDLDPRAFSPCFLPLSHGGGSE